MSEHTINPLPPHRLGLCHVRVVPYPYKERWPEAPFGDRWRALKARMRSIPAPSPAQPAAEGVS